MYIYAPFLDGNVGFGKHIEKINVKHENLINMRSLSLTVIVGFFALTMNAQLPYNPDENGDEIIGIPDVLGILSFFGQEFQAEGVVPVINGGTGAASAEAARDSLGLAMFKDSVITIGMSMQPIGWVNGRLRVTNSIIEGYQTVASGSYAHAEGYDTEATGNFSHSQNRFTTASGTCAHAEGEGTTSSGTASHAEGFQTTATATAAHAEGYQTQALGLYSHAANRNTIADGTCAHAEGEGTEALADAAHSEGYQTEALAFASHAEGYQSVTTGLYAHAQNRGNSASGQNSHAAGLNTIASGQRSHSGGNGTIADQNDQTALGRFNLADQADVLFVVGNGTTNDARSDAFKVTANGNAMVAGDMSVNGNIIVNGNDLLLIIQELQTANALLQQQVNALQEQVDQIGQ